MLIQIINLSPSQGISHQQEATAGQQLLTELQSIGKKGENQEIQEAAAGQQVLKELQNIGKKEKIWRLRRFRIFRMQQQGS